MKLRYLREVGSRGRRIGGPTASESDRQIAGVRGTGDDAMAINSVNSAGSPAAVPGTVQAEDYDTGGPGIGGAAPGVKDPGAALSVTYGQR